VSKLRKSAQHHMTGKRRKCLKSLRDRKVSALHSSAQPMNMRPHYLETRRRSAGIIHPLMRQRLPTTVLFLCALMVTALPATGRKGLQEVPGLPPPVYEELRDDFFMDDAIQLLQNLRTRVEMHEYLTEELGAFLFLLPRPTGEVTTDEFRPTSPTTIQSLTLTIETEGEALRMVHVLLNPDAAPRAERFIEGALQAVDQGGPNQTMLYLLGIHEIDGAQYQVLLRQETSSTGAPLYWIHFY
jgi:hypothetical protein